MYPLSPRTFFVTFLLACLTFCFTEGLAQRSAAELIAKMDPPKGKIDFKDGARQINILNNYLFITNFWAGLQVVDISDINHPKQVAYLPTEDESYYTHIDDRYAYLANHHAGVQVYDIGDIGQIHKVAEIKPPGNVFWVISDLPHIFTALGDEGFAVMDINDLSNPVTVKVEKPGSWIQQLYQQDNLLFAAAKTDGILLYDITDRQHPILLSSFKTGFNTMMIQVVDDVAYIADGPGGMLILDVTDPASPKTVSRFSKIGFVGNLQKAGNYVYLANRDIGLQIVNVSDPGKPFLEGRYETDDISYGVFKKDIYVFLAANTSTLIMRHNNAPVLDNLNDAKLEENVPFSLQLNAREPDGDPILYEVQNLPATAAFDTHSGLFSWTPTYEESGVYQDVVFKVMEQTETKLAAVDTISLTVNHVNRLPDLPALNLEKSAVNENEMFTIAIPAGSDPDKEDHLRLRYRAEKLPAGANFEPDSRIFTWTPAYDQSGTYVIDFLIEDGAGGIDRESVTVTVQHVDRRPTIEAVPLSQIAEAQTVNFRISGSEPDREDLDYLSFSIENLPEGAVFDPVSQLFSWTPGYDQSGTYNNLRAIMKAGNLSDTTTISITVDHVNRPPALATLADQTVPENQVLRFTISGSDPDSEDQGKLQFSAANLPEGAAFDPQTRTFEWQPDYEQSGEYGAVAFTVSDPSGLRSSQAVTIVANHVNRSPAVEAPSGKAVDENTALTFQLAASDPDREDVQSLVFSAEGLPLGALLDSKSGMFSWTPTYDQSGEYRVVFTVSDGQEAVSTPPVTFTVNHVNRAPALSAIEKPSVDENQLLTFSIAGNDEDSEDAGLLTFSARGLPEGAAFDPATRTISWTPDFDQSGQYPVTFSITDPAGLSDQKTADITVHHVNRPPRLAEIARQILDENQPLSIQLNGADPDMEDAGKLIYQIKNLPTGAALDPAGATFNWTPGYDQSGEYLLEAAVRDPAGLKAVQNISLTVNHVNRPPQLAALAVQDGKENEPLNFTVAAADPDQEDQDKLVYSASGLPGGAALNPASGQFTWQPGFEQSGQYALTFQVVDTFGASDALDVQLTIAHVNRPPELPPLENPTLQENSAAQVRIPAGQDPDQEDAGRLTYAIEGLPEGALFDAASAVIAWTPSYEQSGTYRLTASVEDPGGLRAAQTFQISVENINRPPSLTPIDDLSGKENRELTFSLQAQDPDKEDRNKLAYSAGNLPPGAALDAASGRFSWTPAFDQSGEYSLSFQVKDSYGETAVAGAVVRIEHVNRPPEMQTPEGFTVKEEEVLTFRLDASDPDQEDQGALTFVAKNLPAGAEFNSSSGEFSWKPDDSQQGKYTIEFSVKDGSGLSDKAAVNITVEDVPKEAQTPPGEKG